METFSLVKTKRNQFHPTLGTPAAMGDHFSQALAAMYQAKVDIVGCRRLLRAPGTTCIVWDSRWPLVSGHRSGPSNAEGGGRVLPPSGDGLLRLQPAAGIPTDLPVFIQILDPSW